MRTHPIRPSNPASSRARPPPPLKVAIVAAGVEYWPLAQAANTKLSPEHQMSERTISQLATDKKLPTLEQAAVLSRILRRPVHALFPELS